MSFARTETSNSPAMHLCLKLVKRQGAVAASKLVFLLAAWHDAKYYALEDASGLKIKSLDLA